MRSGSLGESVIGALRKRDGSSENPPERENQETMFLGVNAVVNALRSRGAKLKISVDFLRYFLNHKSRTSVELSFKARKSNHIENLCLTRRINGKHLDNNAGIFVFFEHSVGHLTTVFFVYQ